MSVQSSPVPLAVLTNNYQTGQPWHCDLGHVCAPRSGRCMRHKLIDILSLPALFGPWTVVSLRLIGEREGVRVETAVLPAAALLSSRKADLCAEMHLASRTPHERTVFDWALEIRQEIPGSQLKVCPFRGRCYVHGWFSTGLDQTRLPEISSDTKQGLTRQPAPNRICTWTRHLKRLAERQ